MDDTIPTASRIFARGKQWRFLKTTALAASPNPVKKRSARGSEVAHERPSNATARSPDNVTEANDETT
jgi:hypothetical protein